MTDVSAITPEAAISGDKERAASLGRSASALAGSARLGEIPLPERPIAAIDVGTNNCRLLVAKPQAGGFQVIDAFSRVVRLGQQVDSSAWLGRTAMDRTVAALQVCAGKIQRHRVVACRAVATEACRRARNFDEFRRRVLRQTGLYLELITAEEEARLSLGGCAPLIEPDVPWALVFDIGGGSTEVLWVRVSADGAHHLEASISLPLGVVTLAERHGTDRISDAVFERIVAGVAADLHDFDARHRIAEAVAAGQVQMLGSSGTVTTLAGVASGMRRYDRSAIDGSRLDTARALALGRKLQGLDQAGRSLQPCIGRDRADLVVGGCAILEGICRLWPVPTIRVADRGVREGILFDLLQRRRRP